jgi:recombination protein RecA
MTSSQKLLVAELPDVYGIIQTSQEDSLMEDINRKKALAAALSQIDKQFGKGSVMLLGDHPANNDIEVVSTGSLGLDVALGVGGVPRGRVIEVYGPEASGKTTLALSIISQAQKLGGVAAFVDA